MRDIVDRLNDGVPNGIGDFAILMEQAMNEIVQLRAALLTQWEANHFEHCGRDGCTSFGGSKTCMWERPVELK